MRYGGRREGCGVELVRSCGGLLYLVLARVGCLQWSENRFEAGLRGSAVSGAGTRGTYEEHRVLGVRHGWSEGPSAP